MKKIKQLLIFVLLCGTSGAFAQSVTIGEHEFTAHPSAILEVQSTNKGVLIPRLTYLQRNAIAVDSKSVGLLIYQTDHTMPGFYFYDGNTWRYLSNPLAHLENLADVATSGDYDDLTNKPTLFSGNYDDLENKPDLFSGEFADLIGVPEVFDSNYFALKNLPSFEDSIVKYGFDGDYESLTNVPAMFDSNYFALKNLPSFEDSIVKYGFDGDYESLTNVPTVFDSNYFALKNLPSFEDSIVKYGFDGDYESLTNVPAVFDSNYDALKNKPSIHSVAITGNYDDLENKPILFTGEYHRLTGTPNIKDSIVKYGFDGDYESLMNVPAMFDSNYFALKNLPSFEDSIVKYGFDGDYESLTNVPVYSFEDSILKYGFDGDYESLENKPDISKEIEIEIGIHNTNTVSHADIRERLVELQNEISDLFLALDGKSNSGHTHTKASITDFAHTHTRENITDFAHRHNASEIDEYVQRYRFTDWGWGSYAIRTGNVVHLAFSDAISGGTFNIPFTPDMPTPYTYHPYDDYSLHYTYVGYIALTLSSPTDHFDANRSYAYIDSSSRVIRMGIFSTQPHGYGDIDIHISGSYIVADAFK